MSAPEKRSCLVTGAAGFLGRQVVAFLTDAGWTVTTLGRDLNRADIPVDLAKEVPDLGDRRFDVVVHLAGKAHVVPRTDEDKQAFHRVNVDGSRHLLQALEKLSPPPSSVVLASTVAVYGREEGNDLDEDTPLEATDPYGLSKINSEKVLTDWCAENGVVRGIVRLPLIAGPNPPGNLGAMIRAMRKGYYVRLRGNPARRSIVRARDVAAILPVVAERGGVFNLTDGVHPLIAELETALASTLGVRSPVSLPQFPLKLGALCGDVISRTGLPFPLTTRRLRKLTSTLTFSDSRARRELGWRPSPVMEHLQELIA